MFLADSVVFSPIGAWSLDPLWHPRGPVRTPKDLPTTPLSTPNGPLDFLSEPDAMGGNPEQNCAPLFL